MMHTIYQKKWKLNLIDFIVIVPDHITYENTVYSNRQIFSSPCLLYISGLKNCLCLLLSVFLLWHHTAANVQPESQLQTSCNTCCQGPIGSQWNPGIPGVPGNNGMPGSLGPKGDRGESTKGEKGDSIKGDIGLRGEKGDSGSPGLKGESGMDGLRGPPGKIGPPGITGLVGSPGISGVKGQKGEMGQSRQIGQSRVSAFSAVRTTRFTTSSGGQALPFETVYTNVGDDFNAGTGRFTCEIPGIYMFTYNILTNTGTSYTSLMKNNDRINSVYRSSETFHDMIGNGAVLQLAAGDEVWLSVRSSGQQIYSDSDKYTSFSGVMLHEI